MTALKFFCKQQITDPYKSLRISVKKYGLFWMNFIPHGFFFGTAVRSNADLFLVLSDKQFSSIKLILAITFKVFFYYRVLKSLSQWLYSNSVSILRFSSLTWWMYITTLWLLELLMHYIIFIIVDAKNYIFVMIYFGFHSVHYWFYLFELDTSNIYLVIKLF